MAIVYTIYLLVFVKFCNKIPRNLQLINLNILNIYKSIKSIRTEQNGILIITTRKIKIAT